MERRRRGKRRLGERMGRDSGSGSGGGEGREKGARGELGLERPGTSFSTLCAACSGNGLLTLTALI